MNPILRKYSENQFSYFEPKEVHISVFIEDFDHEYKRLDLASNSEELAKGIESCKMILDSGDQYHEIVYEELLNRVFRPKIKLHAICKSVLNYICYHFSIEKLHKKLIEYEEEKIIIVAHVNVETDDYSSVSIIPIIKNEGKVVSRFEIFEKSIHQLSIPSRLEFLTIREKVFLFRVVKFILQSGETCFKTDYSHLWWFFSEQINEEEQEEINKDFLSGVIATLEFYDFISFEQEVSYDDKNDKVILIKIIVFDLEIFGKYYELTGLNSTEY